MLRPALMAALVVAALPACAEPLLGTWASPPDHKGQTGHIVLAPCGAALCGTLVRAFDRNGAPTMTPNVGKQLLWDLHPAGNGTCRARVYVPLMKGEFPAELTVTGDKLTVRGCNALGLCQAQTWQRVN